MCWYVLACLCLHILYPGNAGRGGGVSPACVVLILSVTLHTEREGECKHTGCLEPDQFLLQAHRGN